MPGGSNLEGPHYRLEDDTNPPLLRVLAANPMDSLPNLGRRVDNLRE